jgi:hypothetical protein
MNLVRRQATFEERFHELRPSLHWRVWRDLRCALFIGGLLFRNLTVGRRVRKKYLACKRNGVPFWLDDDPGMSR